MTAHDLEAKQADVALDSMAGTLRRLRERALPVNGVLPECIELTRRELDAAKLENAGIDPFKKLGAIVGNDPEKLFGLPVKVVPDAHAPTHAEQEFVEQVRAAKPNQPIFAPKGMTMERAAYLSNLARAHVSPIVLVLPYPISANRYWTSFQLGKRIMTAPSAEAKAYKRQVAQLVKAQGVRQPLTGRVRIDLKLYPNRPLDWQRRQRKDGQAWDDTVQCLDLDNARKVVYDSLKGLVIEDDKWVRQDTGERMEPDEHGARLVITVTPLPVSKPQTELFGAVEQEVI